MKQHINIEQWEQLTHEQKNKLDNYGTKHDYRMNIGQMIEFLDDHTNELGLQFNDSACHWSIWYGGEKRIEYIDLIEYQLCDALWEAVKDVL